MRKEQAKKTKINASESTKVQPAHPSYVHQKAKSYDNEDTKVLPTHPTYDLQS